MQQRTLICFRHQTEKRRTPSEMPMELRSQWELLSHYLKARFGDRSRELLENVFWDLQLSTLYTQQSFYSICIRETHYFAAWSPLLYPPQSFGNKNGKESIKTFEWLFSPITWSSIVKPVNLGYYIQMNLWVNSIFWLSIER